MAIEACLALLDEFEEVSDETLIPLWVRMGMHWSAQTVRRDDLIGHDVNLASRISDLADAGELMVSQATVEAARQAGASLEFDDMGPTLVRASRTRCTSSGLCATSSRAGVRRPD